ncbi:MAG: hypothetical protein JWM80_6572 [Cyanobacteria bacterium RYN_339]|nr:hypothetical protein [Cyanobacteria bacterium RYN_339]
MRQPRLTALIASSLLLTGCNLFLGNDSLADKIYNNFDFKQQVWSRLDVGAIEDLNTIQMVDGTTGYAAGQKGIVVTTTDGGKTWTPSYPGVMSGQNIVSLAFVSPVQGFAASNKNVYGTQDGGHTWAKLSTPSTTSTLMHLRFATAGVGYAATDKGALQTLDGGKTWTPLKVADGGDFSITSSGVYAAGSGVYHAAVGGDWTGLLEMSSLCSGCNPALPSFISPTEGWVVAVVPNHGNGDFVTVKVLHTTDSGGTWASLTTVDHLGKPLGDYLREVGFGSATAVRFADAQTGWMLFGKGLFATFDGGSTWITQNQSFSTGGFTRYSMDHPTGLGFSDLSVQDAKHAWTVAGKFVYRYDGTLYPAFHETTGPSPKPWF